MKNWMESDYITGSQIFLSPIREEKDKEWDRDLEELEEDFKLNIQ
jgi:hypothetical protein